MPASRRQRKAAGGQVRNRGSSLHDYSRDGVDNDDAAAILAALDFDPYPLAGARRPCHVAAGTCVLVGLSLALGLSLTLIGSAHGAAPLAAFVAWLVLSAATIGWSLR